MSEFTLLIKAGAMIALAILLAGCAAPKALPSGPGAEWNLVVIGDSSLWGFGEAFAGQIEKDQDVKVIIHDFALSNLSAGRVLEVLETGKSVNARLEKLPDALRIADFVIMFANPSDSENPDNPLGIGGCFSGMQPGDCSMETYAQYIVDMKAIWGHIIELRKGKPTILRATDLYNPLIQNWNEAGIAADCEVCWANMSAAARQAAEAYDIPFSSRYDLYNGITHIEDPRIKGLTSEDGEHPSEKANIITAQMFAQVGYKPVSSLK
jgi:hypothetical protein